MKQHLTLAGKSLAGAGLTGVVLYVVGTATQRSWPFWPYWIFIVMLVAGGILYLIGQRSGKNEPLTTVDDVAEADDAKPGPAFTGLWRHTPNGHEAPNLMMITHKGFSHPGYMRSSTEERVPFVRVGAVIACDPLGPLPTTSDLRDRFLSFLRQPTIWNLVRSLTYVGDELSWRSYASNGRINNEAVLTAAETQTEAPVASVMMILNEVDVPRYGRDQRVAELVLHIEPRGEDGNPADSADFQTWYDRIVRALTVPEAFAAFLTHDVGVGTYDVPPTQLGIQLDAFRSINELVDAGDLRTVTGSWPSNSFLGFIIAERTGKPASDATVDLLTRVCDHALHLHGYESDLAKLTR